MVFESQDNIYEVIRLMERKKKYDSYLCRSGKKEYFIYCVKDEDLQRSCCPVFLEMSRQNKCEGLHEIFSDGDSFLFVFDRYSLDIRLEEFYANAQGISFFRKMDVLKQMVSGLCVHEIPVFLACDMFLHGNIGISSDETGQGYYNLQEMEHYESFDMKSFAEIFADCLGRLFAGEMKKKQFHELAEYRTHLQESEYRDFLEFYEDFCRMKKHLEEQLSQSKEKEGILAGKGMDKLKKILGIVKRVLILLILFAAAGVLLWSLRGEKSQKGGIYSYIGDVTIQEYEEESQR